MEDVSKRNSSHTATVDHCLVCLLYFLGSLLHSFPSFLVRGGGRGFVHDRALSSFAGGAGADLPAIPRDAGIMGRGGCPSYPTVILKEGGPYIRV